jgi:uncharacterized protein (DUF2141 family)
MLPFSLNTLLSRFRSYRWARVALPGVASVLALSASPLRAETNGSHIEIQLDIVTANAQGRVLCGVYERAGWLKRPIKGSVASIRGNSASCHFPDLKPGTYAVGAFQDENLNGRLDRNWMGGAAEPWCVSRETRGTIGPPSFDSASFTVAQGVAHWHCRAR